MELIESVDGCKVYNLSTGKSWSEWLEEKKKRGDRVVRKDSSYRNRLELLQGADMPVAIQHLSLTGDSDFLIMSGTYKPQFKVLEFDQLSVKFTRFVDADIVKSLPLEPEGDWRKLCFLRCDRVLDFHIAAGAYYKTRLPKAGRDIAYSAFRAELLAACSEPSLHRLSLEQGRFLAPFVTRRASHQSDLALNAVAVNPLHGLIGTAGTDGVVEMWDPRQRAAVGSVPLLSGGGGVEATALSFADDGLQFAAGSSDAVCSLFDLRSSKPLAVKRHGHSLPIHSVFFHGTESVVSADSALLKVWSRKDPSAKTQANVEPAARMNTAICIGPKDRASGLFAMGCEAKRLQLCFIPSLGPAPKWCGFLDNLTEELEERASKELLHGQSAASLAAGLLSGETHNDYTFVTNDELDKLGLTHMIGTAYLRAHLHGFYIDTRLYRKVLAIVQPFALEEYRKEKARKALEKKRESRIAPVRRLPKVNAKAFEKGMLQSHSIGATADANASPSLSAVSPDAEAAPAIDSRFAALFSDQDFEIDESNEAFKRISSNTSRKEAMKKSREERKDRRKKRGGPDASPQETEAGVEKRRLIPISLSSKASKEVEKLVPLAVRVGEEDGGAKKRKKK